MTLLEAIRIAIAVLTVFTALGLACAVWIALRMRHPQGDPFASPFGEVPSTGFTAEELEAVAPSRLTGDVLNRSLDLPVSAGVPQRTATGGRSMPFGAFARRTLTARWPR